MRTSLHQCLPIIPNLLHQLCALSSSLGDLGLAMKVCLCFEFFGMFRQGLPPISPWAFDISYSTCRGDIIEAPSGLLLVVQWTKTVQAARTTHLLPLPDIPATQQTPREAYSQLITTSPTLFLDQSLLTSRGETG